MTTHQAQCSLLSDTAGHPHRVVGVERYIHPRVLERPTALPDADLRVSTLEDVAARLARSERTVRQWVKDGLLPHVRLDGGALAFELKDIRAFAAARRVSAADGWALAGRPARSGSWCGFAG